MIEQKDTSVSKLDLLGILAVAIASIIGINQYTYGMYNHYITIPFLKSVINPGLYPHDYLIAEKKYFYTYFLSTMAFLSSTLKVSIQQLFFSLYIVSLYATLLGAFKIALTLFRRKEVAYFSIALLVFSITTLGDVRTIESMFLERTLVLPLLLFAIYAFLKEKYVISYILQGIAFLIHPLSSIYVIGFLSISALFTLKHIGWQKLAICLVILVLLVSPSLYLKFKNPAPHLSLFNPDPEWVSLLRLRSSHHLFPFSWDIREWLTTALFLVGFIFTWRHKPDVRHHKIILISCVTIVLFCLAGTIFTELIPTSLVIQFQLFRSFKFIIYFAIFYYANFFFMESESPKSNLLLKGLVLLLFVPVFYEHNLPKYASFLVVALAIFPGYLIVRQVQAGLSMAYLPALISLILLLGVAGFYMRGDFTIYNADEKEWLEVQYWAKENTPQDALFIVPPNWRGFRVESERTVYGDWKDGTQMFFNPDFGKEWIRRMKKIGYVDDDRLQETFVALKEKDFQAVAAEFKGQLSKAYVVMPSDAERLEFLEKYSNEGFVVYEVRFRLR